MRGKNSVRKETRECIVTALVRLTADKPLSAITVTELCRTAGVSRMAFYRNYDSKEEVLSSKLGDLIELYRTVTAGARANGSPWYGEEHLCTTFTFFHANRALVDALLRCGYAQMLTEAIAGYVIDTWGNGTVEGEYVLTGFAGTLISCYFLWRSRDFKETPAQLAKTLSYFYENLPEVNRI